MGHPQGVPRMAILKEERIGNQRLILGDCLQVMPCLGRFDAVVTDPPYGIGYVHGAEKRKFASAHNEKPIIGDDQPFDPAPFLGFDCVFWGANHFASRLPGGGAGSSGISAMVLASTINQISRLAGSVGNAAPTGSFRTCGPGGQRHQNVASRVFIRRKSQS
jgi:hypothetical protein